VIYSISAYGEEEADCQDGGGGPELLLYIVSAYRADEQRDGSKKQASKNQKKRSLVKSFD
jgi:hypothetical protein